MPTIKSVMTPFPYSIELDAGLDAARAMMNEHDIHHLPVASDGRLVGIISKHDLETALAGEPKSSVGELPAVKSCCVYRIYVVGLSEPLDSVLMEMAERHVSSALVVKGEKLAGIFTETDAFTRFAELLRAHHTPSPDITGGDDDDQAA